MTNQEQPTMQELRDLLAGRTTPRMVAARVRRDTAQTAYNRLKAEVNRRCVEALGEASRMTRPPSPAWTRAVSLHETYRGKDIPDSGEPFSGVHDLSASEALSASLAAVRPGGLARAVVLTCSVFGDILKLYYDGTVAVDRILTTAWLGNIQEFLDHVLPDRYYIDQCGHVRARDGDDSSIIRAAYQYIVAEGEYWRPAIEAYARKLEARVELEAAEREYLAAYDELARMPQSYSEPPVSPTYKVLRPDNSAPYVPDFVWPIGRPVSAGGSLEPCSNGLHYCTAEQLAFWVRPDELENGDYIVRRAYPSGEQIRLADKCLARNLTVGEVVPPEVVRSIVMTDVQLPAD